ncbi:SCO family protein [Patiriisocius sp. Uisw_017]|jgi:protein SCO1/2|uniref:SCO family protein n=1 Tax=Patiriisocius sp. Uisw_017 TaxID=3230968 RepID=UPI0039EBD86D
MKTKYIGLAAVVLIFGLIFIPKIFKRLTAGTVVENTRMSTTIEGVSENGDARTNSKKDMPILSNDEIAILEDEEKKGTKISEVVLLEHQTVAPFSFTNQNGETITNDAYKGKVYVVEFFFSTCPSICPIMNTNMLKIENEFKDEDDFGIASITIDPEHDTVQVLKEYAEGYEVSHQNWNFLTGDKTEILKLSNEGFKLYAAKDDNEDGGFSHSGLFALVDKRGIVRSRKDENENPIFYYNGLEDDGVEMLILDIKKLL